MKRLCVVGLGYIGLPTACLFADSGLEVVGVDLSQSRLNEIASGEALSDEPGMRELLRRVIDSGHLRVSSAPVAADAFILAVQTPVPSDHIPRLEALKAAAAEVGKLLRPGNLVVIESTVPPGATSGAVASVLENASRLNAGKDFYLAYCPERAIPGSTLREMVNNDRLVGGVDRASTTMATHLYSRVVKGELLATDASTAEVVKLSENTYRDVNIALANELARLCEKSGASVWEVVALANRHPRVHLHQPGPGVGGSCLPKDPWFLVSSVPEQLELIPNARRTNEEQPVLVAKKALGLLKQANVPKPPKVALLGVAYKGGIGDVRETPALPILAELRKNGAVVAAYDPHVQAFQDPLSSLDDALSGADLIMLVTDHPEMKRILPEKARALVRTPLLFDTRNFLDHSLWRSHGFRVTVLGVGG